jgi:hypothetical protein
LNAPVVVHRPSSEGRQFYERTQTLVVSAHRAPVALKDMVVPRQKLLLQNTDSGEQRECHVVYVRIPVKAGFENEYLSLINAVIDEMRHAIPVPFM